MEAKTALIIVDLNNDFLPGGALGVAGGDVILPVINKLAGGGDYAIVVATQDWHLGDHVSFETWPAHCVAGTFGAELHADLNQANVHAVIRKGFDQDVDSYSGFYDERGATNGLAELLKARGIECVDIVGIATDYCVKATAIDAVLRAGLKARVLLEACRGVGVHPGDIDQAIEAMRTAGVEIVDGTL
ncbi:nicotinamidase [Coraliomargarita sp. SDUM461003]|uniref:nicotinamidase n=1 Tax=Thalassobacterium maritimum TaxID=3041265 RepID=A0ABU1AUP7_9BACT|nr:nicotinamidase [Coraliomargarita sp. SDUM461003]MDQ8207880.1 nicotinamidase [Coraliomargarita sp. SDUM461003]